MPQPRTALTNYAYISLIDWVEGEMYTRVLYDAANTISSSYSFAVLRIVFVWYDVRTKYIKEIRALYYSPSLQSLAHNRGKYGR
jgi:hypothetical protein